MPCYRVTLDNRDKGEPALYDATHTLSEAALSGLCGDVWNAHAAHLPDRGWRLRAREVQANGKLSRILQTIS